MMKKLIFLFGLFFIVSCDESTNGKDELFKNPIIVLDDVDSSPVTGEEDGLAIIQQDYKRRLYWQE